MTPDIGNACVSCDHCGARAREKPVRMRKFAISWSLPDILDKQTHSSVIKAVEQAYKE